MDLVFTCEHRFRKGSNGLIYSIDSSYNNSLWKRYLTKFDRIIILARVEQSGENLPEEMLAQMDRVSFVELPYYLGPLDYIKKSNQIKKIIKKEALPNRAYICRVPGNIGRLLVKELKKNEINYGVEVVGDPWDVFAPGSISHPLRHYFRYSGYQDLKRIVKNASSVLYVTREALQKRYPVSENVFTTNASNVLIDIEEGNTSKVLKNKEYYNLISVGSLAQMYKSPDIVIKAIKILRDKNIRCRLTWLGDGIFMSNMKTLAEELKIDDLVNFKGNVSKTEVLSSLQYADVFLLVSKTEGLPRAMIEAMACGLPCIGSKVGGIPELLDEQAIVPPSDEFALAKVLERMFTDLDFTNQQAKRNLNVAKQYDNAVLQKKRESFYDTIISLSK